MTPREAALALLDARAEGASVCPSEVARALAGEGGDWRAAMPKVHAQIDRMSAEGLVSLSWKGRTMPQRKGPYRIHRCDQKASGL